MRLRNKPLHIKEIDEFSEKRKFNIGKFIYLLFLVTVVAFIFWKWGKGFLYIKGRGQIKISRLNVQEITDIRLLKIKVKEGSKVSKGEILFTFTRYPGFTTSGKIYGGEILNRTKEYMKLKEEMRKTNYELKKKLKERNFISKEIKERVKKQEKARKLLLLRIGTADEVERISQEIKKLTHQKNLINEEIKYLQNQFQNLRQLIYSNSHKLEIHIGWKNFPDYSEIVFKGNRDFEYELSEFKNKIELEVKDKVSDFIPEQIVRNGLIQSINFIKDRNIISIVFLKNVKIRFCSSFLFPPKLIVQISEERSEKISPTRKKISCKKTYGEVFRSPFSGMVTRIYFNNYEVALKGEKIMTIFQPGEIHIKGFFEQPDLKYLKTGDNVIIEFPDSSKYEGKISRLYYASLPLPPEFQKKYEPIHRSIVADIVPLNPNLMRDKEVEKMSVTLWVKKNLFRKEK